MDIEEPFDDIEGECVEYVAGYVANRYSNKYPDLIDLDGEEECRTNHISRGQLKMPSQNLMRAMKQLEIYFTSLHGDNLSKAPTIFTSLTNKLLSHENYNIPKEVVECLVRTRTYIRQNNLNNQLICQKHKKFEK